MARFLPDRYRLPALYALLVIVIIGTIFGSLALNQRLLTVHAESLKSNLEWGLRTSRYTALGRSVMNIDVPCNDVFETKRPEAELVRFNQAREKFWKAVELEVDDLRRIPDPELSERLQGHFNRICHSVKKMERDGLALFTHFQKGSMDIAGQRMAWVDRSNAEASMAFDALYSEIREKLVSDFNRQGRRAKNLRGIELLLIGAFLPLVVALIGYGTKLWREIDLAREGALQASRAKSMFLANMSHEIRTPMNGILGMTHLVLEGELPENQRKQVQIIKSSAQSLLTVLNDILDFSKIEAGKLLLEHVPFDVALLFEETMALFHPQARQKGISMTHTMDGPRPIFVWGDPHRLRQVIVNLLSNAIKFTEKGSVDVVLRAHLNGGEGAELILDVQDTGIGMSGAVLGRIFNPFEQGDSSTTRRFGGTGLGLAVCHHLVGLMGGTLSAESQEGRGSLFRLKLPVTLSQCQSEDPKTSSAHQSPEVRGLKILLAEDNPVNQLVASGILKKRGHLVTVAPHGKAAVEAFERENWDVILMDQHMPEMGGLEATRIIRSIEASQGSRVPIIALTASAMMGDRDVCLASGMDAYVAKPFEPLKLLQVIEQTYLDRQKPRAA